MLALRSLPTSHSKVLIISDFLSIVSALRLGAKHRDIKDPRVPNTGFCHRCKNLMVPGPAGIPGNEMADQLTTILLGLPFPPGVPNATRFLRSRFSSLDIHRSNHPILTHYDLDRIKCPWHPDCCNSRAKEVFVAVFMLNAHSHFFMLVSVHPLCILFA